MFSGRWDKDILNSHRGVPLLLADINRRFYGTCDKIGGSKPQLRYKQVGRIITPVALDLRKLKQKS